MAQLAENRYGKSRVRLVRVNRQAAVHEFEEWSVDVVLRGDFLSCFVEGDNSKILPTDTMKNTVYSLARKSSATCTPCRCAFTSIGRPAEWRATSNAARAASNR